MSAQTTYKFSMTKGAAGGIFDLAPYEVNAFSNEENTGDLTFGMGVVTGTKAGITVALPSANTDVFEGVVTNRRTTERDLEGGLSLRKNATVGVMRYGRIFVKLAAGEAPAYGDAVYLIYTGTGAGCFSKSSTNAIAINAKFIGSAENGVAPIELVNGAIGGGSEYELPKASATVLGGVKIGTGLEIDANGVLNVNAG